MKKQYTIPEIEKIDLDLIDILTTSGTSGESTGALKIKDGLSVDDEPSNFWDN